MSDDYDKFEIGARRASLTESVSELATTADENANKALNQALVALQSADGKTTIYYLNSSDPWPTNPNENDTAFVKMKTVLCIATCSTTIQTCSVGSRY